MQTNVFVVYTLKYKNETGSNQFCVSEAAIGCERVTWLQAPPHSLKRQEAARKNTARCRREALRRRSPVDYRWWRLRKVDPVHHVSFKIRFVLPYRVRDDLKAHYLVLGKTF